MAFTYNENVSRWRIPFIGKGARNLLVNAGHWKILGIQYSWNDSSKEGWEFKRILQFWGLFSIIHEDTQGGKYKAVHPGFRISFAKLNIKLIKAKSY